jgi:hypothetical protein
VSGQGEDERSIKRVRRKKEEGRRKKKDWRPSFADSVWIPAILNPEP